MGVAVGCGVAHGPCKCVGECNTRGSLPSPPGISLSPSLPRVVVLRHFRTTPSLPCSSLPHIKDFIDKQAKGYAPQLKVVYSSSGGAPRLRFSGGPGGASETVRIDNWKTSSIVEFLNERLDRSRSTNSAVA